MRHLKTMLAAALLRDATGTRESLMDLEDFVNRWPSLNGLHLTVYDERELERIVGYLQYRVLRLLGHEQELHGLR